MPPMVGHGLSEVWVGADEGVGVGIGVGVGVGVGGGDRSEGDLGVQSPASLPHSTETQCSTFIQRPSGNFMKLFLSPGEYAH